MTDERENGSVTNPRHSATGFSDNEGHWPGLTKREYFAAAAMQGLLAVDYAGGGTEVTVHAVRCADALIEELNK